jgi:hypothetical protein
MCRRVSAVAVTSSDTCPTHPQTVPLPVMTAVLSKPGAYHHAKSLQATNGHTDVPCLAPTALAARIPVQAGQGGSSCRWVVCGWG